MTRLALALLLVAAPARADCQPDGEAIRCDVATLEAWRQTTLDAEHDRDVALAANERLAAELRAGLAREDRLAGERAWWAAAGVGVGLVLGVLVGVVVAR